MRWAFAFAVLLLSVEARAQDIALPRRQPAPLVLPELTHPRNDVGLTWNVGRGTNAVEGQPNAALGLARFAIEGRLVEKRRFYAGITYDYAAALPPDGGADLDAPGSAPNSKGLKSAFGNAEAHVRAAFPLSPGLVSGFELGAVFPTATIDRNGAARSAMLAASSLLPTDYVHFLPGRMALRPAGDLRIVRGPFVFQARQGFDIMFDVTGHERVRTAGRILAHLGVMPTPDVELSVEASQIYFFFTEDPPNPPNPAVERYRISDDRRTAFTVGPALRVSFTNLDIGAGVVTNLFDPLSPALGSLLALRLSLIAHLR